MISTPPYKPEQWLNAVGRMIIRLTIYTLLVVLGVVIVGRLKIVIGSLIIAGTLAYVVRPMAVWMARKCVLVPRRCNMRTRRMLTTLYVLVLIFVGGFYATRYALGPFVSEVRVIVDNWGTNNSDDLRRSLDQSVNEFHTWYRDHISLAWQARIDAQLSQGFGTDMVRQRMSEWLTTAAKQSGAILNYIVEIVLLPVMAYYMALDSKMIKHEFAAMIPKRRRRDVLRLIHQFNNIMVSYVIGQAILCLIAGVFIGCVLALMGVKYPTMLGMLSGFTRAIPIVGPIIGGIPIVILVLATKGVGLAAGVLALFTFMHFAESKFLMPILIGDRMKLHPAVVIVVLLIGQEFGGLLGMFFAPPVAALLRVICRRYWLRRANASRQKPATAA